MSGPGYSYYASSGTLRPHFYQSLVDRGWRRSGTLLYRPNQRNACCPHYALRLDSAAFKPSRDQRQAINRFNRHVLGDTYAKEAARRYPRSREESRKRDTTFDLVERAHEAENHRVPQPPKPAHDFTVSLEPDTFTEEKYAVFESYQRAVHGEGPDRISRHGFKRFLCSSPLGQETDQDAEGRERRLGSFHQCYRLDGRLVAVGVLDLLPHAVSAVYFMYHESVHSHNFGKLGALHEIALATEGGYRWWYSGFYIHGCPKMRYKIDYQPQYVLDPESLEWDQLTGEALAVFDRQPYVSLSRERRKRRFGEDALPEEEWSDSQSWDGDDAFDDKDSVLLHSNMPGIPSLEQMKQVDLDHIAIHVPDRGYHETGELTVWPYETITDFDTLKAKVAELVAAIGPDLIPDICLRIPDKS